MPRKKGSNGERLDKCDKRISELEEKLNKYQGTFDKHIEDHIIEDLQTPRFPGSDKPLYTYEEIAEKRNVTKAKVQKIANENNLTRRSLKRIK